MYSKIFIFLITGILFISGCKNRKTNSEPGQNDTTAGNYKPNNSFATGEFYFVGMIDGNPGIYKFVSQVQKSGKLEKSITKFWSKNKEKVIKLSYSLNKRSLFFLTAEDYGKKAILPYISGIKLYRISLDSSKVKFIKKIGNGVQVFTMWGQDNTFRVILNTFDRNSADFVNQQTFIFNGLGKTVSSKSKKFNILKEGYPQIIEKIGLTTSPGSKYSIFAVDSMQTSIYLQTNSDGKVELISSSSQRLNQADWSQDDKYLFFSTTNPSTKGKTGNEKNSKIFIYSIDSKKVIKTMDAGTVRNFFATGDLLIFDKGFQKNSFIEIINYKTLKPIYSIHLQDGCGLKGIL
ncbi:MAG: hypothetical protein P4L45_00975 [Ignavibacteriaceae bacterium]|nr:hypothetical protein [Ignavibacteriaceae bacterium]